MEKEYMSLELYKAHLKSKDAYTDRIFMSNRYYLGIVLILLIIGIKDVFENNLYPLLTVPISIAGVVVSLIWWFTQDAYNEQIKVKYQKILEKLEEDFSYQPLKEEYKTLQQNKKKRLFIMPETQKYFSITLFYVFIVMFLSSFIPVIITIISAR